MVIVGQAGYARADGEAVLSMAVQIAQRSCAGKDAAWNGFNVLHAAAGRVGWARPRVRSGQRRVGCRGHSRRRDELRLSLGRGRARLSQAGVSFVVYQGSHGDAGALAADVILPGAAYTEKSVTYVNTEGRAQRTLKGRLRAGPGEGRLDDRARPVRAGSARTLPYDTLNELRGAHVQGRAAACGFGFDRNAASFKHSTRSLPPGGRAAASTNRRRCGRGLLPDEPDRAGHPP